MARTFRPHAPRRRSAAPLALALLAGTTLAGCTTPRLVGGGRGGPNAAEQPQVLGCAAEVAQLDGLAVLERLQDAGGMRLRVGSPAALRPEQVAVLAGPSDLTPGVNGVRAPLVDVLTVSFGHAPGNPAQRGLQVVAQTFHLLREAGTAAVRWLPLRPSPTAAETRDHILRQCGTLG